jgi:N6-L-threonylcarbamoyladenine synthase
MAITILGIESSCDDTAASVISDGYLLSNLIANQKVHEQYGGVVPELASRAHQQNIIPVVDQAIKMSGITIDQISAVAFTRGPGLMGSLLVGSSFAKGFALAKKIPLIDINHLHGHILVHFIKEKGKEQKMPEFPFLCLLVSGGHTQLIVVKNFLEMEIIGQTIDDASGEAFDKCAKVIGLPYPGGPVIDKLSQHGDPETFKFSKPVVDDLDFSFSGLKTSFLYFLRDKLQEDATFIESRKHDLCASLQQTIVEILLDKLVNASKLTGIKQIALAGGVSANSGLRNAVMKEAEKRKWSLFLPEFRFTTDNAAMIAIAGYYKYMAGQFASHDIAPLAKMN